MTHRRKKTKAQIKKQRLRNLKKARAQKKRNAKNGKKGGGFKVCFCKESIKWIMKHLQKSAKAKFRRMIGK